MPQHKSLTVAHTTNRRRPVCRVCRDSWVQCSYTLTQFTLLSLFLFPCFSETLSLGIYDTSVVTMIVTNSEVQTWSNVYWTRLVGAKNRVARGVRKRSDPRTCGVQRQGGIPATFTGFELSTDRVRRKPLYISTRVVSTRKLSIIPATQRVEHLAFCRVRGRATLYSVRLSQKLYFGWDAPLSLVPSYFTRRSAILLHFDL